MARLAPIFLLCWIAGMVPLRAQQKTELDRLRDSWNTELAKIDQEYMTFIKKYEPVYVKNLQNLEGQLQKAGKLQPMLRVRNERKRFIQTRRLERNDLSELPDLQPLQQAYLRATEKASVSRARKISTLALRYEKSLALLRTKFTKQNMIKSAIRVDAELKALQENRELEEADSLIADYSDRIKRQQEAARLARQHPRGTKSGTNRFKGSDRSRVRSRFKDMVEVILEQDYKKAEKLVDPEFVKEHGSNGIKIRLDVLHLVLKVVEAYNGDIDVDKIEIDDTETTAKVIPEVDYKIKKESLDPVIFVKVSGDWYMQFED